MIGRLNLINLLAALCVAFSTMIHAQAGYASDDDSVQETRASLHDVARQIRQIRIWQILDARSRQKASGYRYFQFKLLRSDGRVKIINIDPNNPNLRALEQ